MTMDEIIKCQDCQHWWRNSPNADFGFCACWLVDLQFNFFCAYARPRLNAGSEADHLEALENAETD